jgi:hypothetical protein
MLTNFIDRNVGDILIVDEYDSSEAAEGMLRTRKSLMSPRGPFCVLLPKEYLVELLGGEVILAPLGARF